MGINAFYDYAFKEHYKRASLGVEYVTGENELYANFYKPFGHSGEFYVQTMYTLGKSKFALFGGKHSDSSMTTARSKMLDKIERQDMQDLNLNGDFRVHYPHDHL